MAQVWSAISAIGTAVGALVVILAGLYARSQVNEAKLTRKITLLIEFQRQYHSVEFREFRRRLLAGEFGDPESFDPQNLSAREKHEFYMLFDQLDFLGLLVERQLIDFNFVFSAFHRTPPRVWEAVKPFTLRRREVTSNPLLGVHIERLARKYNEELPGHAQ